MRIRTFHRSFQAILVISFVLCVMAVVSAQPELDVAFNTTGKAVTPISDRSDVATAVAVQADNKVVAIGTVNSGSSPVTFGLIRYNVDGTLDASFGDQGKVVIQFNPNAASEAANAVAIQPDGKILVGGRIGIVNPGQGFLALARYNTDGTLDTTFGNGGLVSSSAGEFMNEIRAIAIQPDGKIIAAGSYFFAGQSFQTLLVRFNTNGTPDTSFGSNGVATNVTGGSLGHQNVPASVAVQPDGKIVTGGLYSINMGSSVSSDLTILRFNANGTLDNSFATNGRMQIISADNESISSVRALPDGKILAAGTTGEFNSSQFLLLRLNSNGTLDSSFDGDGRVTTAVESVNSAKALSVHPNGKITVVGNSGPPSGFFAVNFAVAAYNPDGSLDTSFSGDGKLAFDFSGVKVTSSSTAIDSLGRIVIAGYTGSSQSKFAVARLYTRDPIPVSITGRILTPEGVPVRGVSVGLSNSNGETLWTLSSPFGYYQFAGIMTGRTYTVHVSSKRYLVQDKLIGLNEELTDLDLTGTPRTENAGKLSRENLKR